MHLSMHNWMRSEPIEVTVARLARFGYGSIEIKGEPDQYDTADVRKLLADNGLTFWGAVTLTLAERNLCAKDEQQRAASVQYVKDCVTMVKELDGQEITIVPSTVGNRRRLGCQVPSGHSTSGPTTLCRKRCSGPGAISTAFRRAPIFVPGCSRSCETPSSRKCASGAGKSRTATARKPQVCPSPRLSKATSICRTCARRWIYYRPISAKLSSWLGLQACPTTRRRR